MSYTRKVLPVHLTPNSRTVIFEIPLSEYQRFSSVDYFSDSENPSWKNYLQVYLEPRDENDESDFIIETYTGEIDNIIVTHDKETNIVTVSVKCKYNNEKFDNDFWVYKFIAFEGNSQICTDSLGEFYLDSSNELSHRILALDSKEELINEIFVKAGYYDITVAIMKCKPDKTDRSIVNYNTMIEGEY